jgi:cysteinyl-tRNA synthetase
MRLRTARFEPGTNDRVSELTKQALNRFEESLDDDLNTAEALGTVFEWVRDMNTAMDEGSFRAGDVAAGLAFLQVFDSIFDVLKPTEEKLALSEAEIDQKIADRNAARKAKDFKKADEIRAWLLEKGIVIEDTRDGVRWKKK